MATTNYDKRRQAIFYMERSGSTPPQIAQELGRSVAWVYKWQTRFKQGGWEALHDQSRAPKQPARRISEGIKRAIRAVRSELEAEAHEPGRLSYVGAHAIRSRLNQRQVKPLPSVSSIERELRAAGMVRPRPVQEVPQADYPHVKPRQPHQLVQVDIVPHYLPGGQAVACFNAIDVVSRYPTGQPSPTKRATDAVRFLLQVWHELGIPDYTQVDNEGCFSGGFTHPYVLGRALRLGLWVGTQLIYSPIYHPESNAYIERFHQDYNRHVWDKLDLPDLTAVQTQAPVFFDAYRQSHHHSALQGRSPADLHLAQPFRRLPDPLTLPPRLPLTAGQVHFIRRVETAHSIRLLNIDWAVPSALPDQGVWATLTFRAQGATLAIFDAAPGLPHRHCLALHPFPLQEPVLPLQACFRCSQGHPTFLRTWAARSIQWLSTMF